MVPVGVDPPPHQVFDYSKVDDPTNVVQLRGDAVDLRNVAVPMKGATLPFVPRDAVHRVPLQPSTAGDHLDNAKTTNACLERQGQLAIPSQNRYKLGRPRGGHPT